MSSPERKRRPAAEDESGAFKKKVPPVRVVGSERQANAPPTKLKPKPKIRVITPQRRLPIAGGRAVVVGRHVMAEDGMVLTTMELRHRFSVNLDRLLGLVGLGRKEVAEAVGMPYQSLRRLVSAGVSRPDQRSQGGMKRLADFFMMPDPALFWHYDVVEHLLTTDEGSQFVDKFRDRLASERQNRLAEQADLRKEEAALVGRALGLTDAVPAVLTGPVASKVKAILQSSKAEHFRRILDDYYALATATEGSGDSPSSS